MKTKQPVIKLKEVGVTYIKKRTLFSKKKEYKALKNVSMDIYSGETLGIIGINGAGKSTLLKLISDVIKPDTGHIIRTNVSVSLLALQSGFDQNLTGKDNAILTGMLLGTSFSEIKNKLHYIHTFSELDEFFYQPLRTYSTGMRMRLAFSISIACETDVLLIDEVLGVGDKHFRLKAEREIIKRISTDQTVVLVSHSEHFIRKLCDRVILLQDGISYTFENIDDAFKYYHQSTQTANL